MSEGSRFSYDVAFSRNIGWVTEAEQEKLCHTRVVVGGLGGVGGSHLLTLARLGIGAFSITDLDTFDWPNLNRQAGALVSTMGLPKLDVMAEQVRGINPSVDLRLLPTGLNADNIDHFLDGVHPDHHDGKGEEHEPAGNRERFADFGKPVHRRHTFCVVARPSSPAGRKIRMTTSSAKANTSS